MEVIVESGQAGAKQAEGGPGRGGWTVCVISGLLASCSAWTVRTSGCDTKINSASEKRSSARAMRVWRLKTGGWPQSLCATGRVAPDRTGRSSAGRAGMGQAGQAAPSRPNEVGPGRVRSTDRGPWQHRRPPEPLPLTAPAKPRWRGRFAPAGRHGRAGRRAVGRSCWRADGRSCDRSGLQQAAGRGPGGRAAGRSPGFRD